VLSTDFLRLGLDPAGSSLAKRSIRPGLGRMILNLPGRMSKHQLPVLLPVPLPDFRQVAPLGPVPSAVFTRNQLLEVIQQLCLANNRITAAAKLTPTPVVSLSPARSHDSGSCKLAMV
jgi:hypothetical protein